MTAITEVVASNEIGIQVNDSDSDKNVDKNEETSVEIGCEMTSPSIVDRHERLSSMDKKKKERNNKKARFQVHVEGT